MVRRALILLGTIASVYATFSHLNQHRSDQETFTCHKQNYNYGSKTSISQNTTFLIMPGVKDFKVKIRLPFGPNIGGSDSSVKPSILTNKMPQELSGFEITICDNTAPRIQFYTPNPRLNYMFLLIRRKGNAEGEAFGIAKAYFKLGVKSPKLSESEV